MKHFVKTVKSKSIKCVLVLACTLLIPSAGAVNCPSGQSSQTCTCCQATFCAASGGQCPTCKGTPSSYSKTVSAPDGWIESINSALEKLPHLEANISAASVGISGTMENCCDNQSPIVNGKKSASGSTTITGTVSGNLWGYTYGDEKTGHIPFVGDTNFEVEIVFGIPVTIPINASANIGYVYDQCQAKDWVYGEVSVNLTPQVAVTIMASACLSIDGHEFDPAEFNITPAQLDLSCTGTLGYNSSDSACGAYGTTTVESIIYTASIQIPGFSWSKEFVIYGGG